MRGLKRADQLIGTSYWNKNFFDYDNFILYLTKFRFEDRYVLTMWKYNGLILIFGIISQQNSIQHQKILFCLCRTIISGPFFKDFTVILGAIYQNFQEICPLKLKYLLKILWWMSSFWLFSLYFTWVILNPSASYPALQIKALSYDYSDFKNHQNIQIKLLD